MSERIDVKGPATAMPVHGTDFDVLLTSVELGRVRATVYPRNEQHVGPGDEWSSQHEVDADRLALLLRLDEADRLVLVPDVVARLRELRESLEDALVEDMLESQGVIAAGLDATRAALLEEVCGALGLSDAEMRAVMGEQAMARLEEHRVGWPTIQVPGWVVE